MQSSIAVMAGWKLLWCLGMLCSIHVSPLYGAKSSREDVKKIKCLYHNIVTCGISDDQTPCEERSATDNEAFEALSLILGNTVEELKSSSGAYGHYSEQEDAKKALEILTAFQPKSKKLCNLGLGLSCINGKCGYQCEGDEVHRETVKQLWDEEEYADDKDYKCKGTEYDKCPVKPDDTTLKPEPSTEEDVRQLKCLYKKIINCGLAENKQCTNENLTHYVYHLNPIIGLSLAEMQKNGRSNIQCEVKETMKQLNDGNFFNHVCSMSEGLSCSSQQCSKVCNVEEKLTQANCDDLKRISEAEDWKADYNCGDLEKCDNPSGGGGGGSVIDPAKETTTTKEPQVTTTVKASSTENRSEMVNVNGTLISLMILILMNVFRFSLHPY